MSKRPKPKFYTVWEGRKPGVYDNWEDASAQIHGFKGAKFKSFPTRAAAEAAFGGPPPASTGDLREPARPKPLLLSTAPAGEGPIPDSVAVDAACSGAVGPTEYRGVDLSTGEELFHVGPLEQGTGNIGEFLAIVHALALLKKQGRPHTAVYSDSYNARLWVRQRRCGTNLERTPANAQIFGLVERALKWLRENEFTNPILTWKTAEWGENPADFNRK
jgi:ribonuclease HI